MNPQVVLKLIGHETPEPGTCGHGKENEGKDRQEKLDSVEKDVLLLLYVDLNFLAQAKIRFCDPSDMYRPT